MIALLEGQIVATKNPIIIKVGGVGYAVYVPEKLRGSLRDGSILTVYTHTHVREDALLLFGFQSTRELSLFELLLTVSGIGPKTSLTVVDRGVDAVERAVTAGDSDFFLSIPRLGKKNAQKIIIELRSKLGGISDLDLTEDSTSETRELLEALLSMGFARHEALGAIKKLTSQEVTVEQKIRRALTLLAK